MLIFRLPAIFLMNLFLNSSKPTGKLPYKIYQYNVTKYDVNRKTLLIETFSKKYFFGEIFVSVPDGIRLLYMNRNK